MIKEYCDKCEKEIDTTKDTHSKIWYFGELLSEKDKLLCYSCTQDLNRWTTKV